MAEKTIEQLQDQYNKLEEDVLATQAKMQEIGAEMNRRRGEATAAVIYEGIDKGLLPAIVRLGTLELGAQPGGVEANGSV